MKKVNLNQLVLFSAAVFFLSSCSNTVDNIPPLVKQTLYGKYKNVQNLKWEHSNDSAFYIANFDLDSIHYVSNFSPIGKWLKSEHLIAFHLIPMPVRESLELSFGFFTIENATFIEGANGLNWYKIELDSGGDEIELVIEADGKIHNETVWNESNFDFGD